jgi:hypothetical protein
MDNVQDYSVPLIMLFVWLPVHDRIISLRGVVSSHKTSITWNFYRSVYQAMKVSGHVFLC